MTSRAQMADEAAAQLGSMSPQMAADLLKKGVTPNGEALTSMTKRVLHWRATSDEYKRMLINKAAAARRSARRASYRCI